jgi:hypothetical protein
LNSLRRRRKVCACGTRFRNHQPTGNNGQTTIPTTLNDYPTRMKIADSHQPTNTNQNARAMNGV